MKLIIKRFLPKHLFGRAIIIIVFPMVLIQLFSAYIFYEKHWDTVRRRMAMSFAGEVAFFAHKVGLYPDKRDATAIEARDFVKLNVKFSNDKFVELPLEGDDDLKVLYEKLQERMVFPFNVKRDIDGNIIIDIGLSNGTLTISASEERLVSTITYIFVLLLALATVVLSAISIWFIGNQIKPIYALAKATEQFGKGRETNLKPRGALEVRQASRAFLTMQERIKRQITMRTEMLAAISHDLRTPLTRMRLQLEMMPDEDGSISELKEDVIEMQTMIKAYLNFTKGEEIEESKKVNLGDFLQTIADGYLRENKEIKVTASDDVYIHLKHNTFIRCMQNLVNNGFRYANSVEINSWQKGKTITIQVDDDGDGIPEEKRNRVFEPFNRLDESRNLNTGGVGLGLTIARDIVTGHGGEIKLKDAELGGLRVEIKLPV